VKKKSAASRGSSGDLVKVKQTLLPSQANTASSNSDLGMMQRLTNCLLHLQLPDLSGLLEQLNTYELTDQQYWILTFLKDFEEGLSMGDIAKRILQSTGATTSTVDGMEQLGVARRHLPKADRRKVYAQLTPKGVEVLNEILRKKATSLQKQMALLDAAEISAWVSGAEKIATQLKPGA
jgi:DNA-binding MarR family transcriptional regulator